MSESRLDTRVARTVRHFDSSVDGTHRDRLNYDSRPSPTDGQPVALRRLERTPAS